MKKIILLLATLATIMGCSKNEENQISNPLHEKLIGKWRYLGDVTYDIDAPGGELLDPYNGISIKSFYYNNTFDTNTNNIMIANGTFNVSSQDSLLYRVYYESGQIIYKDSIKIRKLNSNLLETSSATEPIIDNHNHVSRYEKITTP